MIEDGITDDILARLDHYRQFLSAEENARLVESLKQPRMPAIRINTLKISVEDARRMWPEWYGWQIARVPFCAAGWQILSQEQRIGQTLEHDNGDYYVQDAASMLPAEMFSVADAPLILDLAAAPGGKTTHLASRFEDRGVILANDTSAKRIAALRANLQTWGVFGALVTNAPGERLGHWFPETFDKVLVDAPCSGDTLRITSGRRTRAVSDREREALCQRQDALLTSAIQAARPGGEIVYATCALAPEEDEAILDGLLRRYQGLIEIEFIGHLPLDVPGLTSDGRATFDPQVRRAIRLWPHVYQTSGFFAARIRKTGAIPVEAGPPPTRSWAEIGLVSLPRVTEAGIVERLRQTYGFDFSADIEARGLTLWQRGKSIVAIPERLVAAFGDLAHMSVGFMIGQRAEGEFVPSHELITRFWPQFVEARLLLTEEQSAIWLAGRDLRDPPALPYAPGAVILLQDDRGRFLGRGKLLRDRIRNLLPKRITRI